jgi:hypothetical protein
MSAIPTTHAGWNFRSRLEAKWAHLFTLLGWRWQYEPIDLDGYIPDFVISGKSKRLLVEVKPFIDLDEKDCPATTCGSCPGCIQAKIDGSGWKGDAIIVGTSPVMEPFTDCTYGPRFGWHGQQFAEDDKCSLSWDRRGEWSFCDRCSQYTVVNRLMRWECSLCGWGIGKAGCADLMLLTYWSRAHNATQWRRQ